MEAIQERFLYQIANGGLYQEFLPQQEVFDQMAECEPCEHAKRFMKRPAYYGVLGYLRHKNINTGEEIGRGQRMLEKVSEESEGITEP